MRLSREDVAPLVVIIAAGWVGAVATFAALTSLTLTSDAPAELRVENDDFAPNAFRVEIITGPTFSFTIYGDLIERVEGLEARQREVAHRVSVLTMSDRADQTEEIAGLRSMKRDMIEAINDLERVLNRAERAAPSLGFRAIGSAADLMRESRLEEKVRYSRGTIEQWDSESAMALEHDIEANLKALRELFVNDLARGVVFDLDRSEPSRR